MEKWIIWETVKRSIFKVFTIHKRRTVGEVSEGLERKSKDIIHVICNEEPHLGLFSLEHRCSINI